MKMLLRAQRIEKLFLSKDGDIAVLKGIDYTFEQDHSYAISGASGTGKSTLLHILAGLTAPTKGSVMVNEQNMSLFDDKQREQFLNKTVGLLFQMPYLVKELTVLENVMSKAYIAGTLDQDAKNRAIALLEQVGLKEKIHALPPVLSGGQQQRVALARALFNKPAFLLADEPTGNLDPKTGAMIVDLLLQYQKEWGMGIIISTHDDYVAERMQTRLLLTDGNLKKI